MISVNENLNCKELTIEVKRLREEVLSLTQSKNELLTSKQQLDAIMDNAPVEVIFKDREGRYVRINKQFEKIFGVKNNDLVGMFPADTHEPTLAAVSREHDLSVLNSGEAEWREEVTELVGDSSLHTFSTLNFPIFNVGGEVDGLGSIITDITESAVAKKKLRNSNTLFSQTEQFGKLGHWEWDEIAGRYITCSEQYASIFGMTMEQMIESITSLNEDQFRVCEEDRERYKQTLDVAREHKKRWQIEYRGVNKAGLPVYLHEIGEPVLDDHGVMIKTVGMIQDITEIREVEAELERSHMLYHQAEEMGNMGHFSRDLVNDQLMSCSEQFARIYGFNVREALNYFTSVDALIDLIHPEDRERFKLGVSVHGAPTNKKHIEYRIILLGKTRHLYLRREVAVDNNGAQSQVFGIVQDITAEKEKEFALFQATEEAVEAVAANLTKSQFLAAMSHEIRTPMAGVIGMSNFLIDSDLSSQQLDWVTSIKSSSKNLMSILNEILDQSKLEAGMVETAPLDFHLRSFVHDQIHLFEPNLALKGLTLDIKLDDDLPEAVYADSMRIGQILSNFLSNALKFTSTGRVEVAVKLEPNGQDELQLRFTVTDSGIGLTEEEKNRIFSAFTQADSSISRTYGGTGLGLSISKQLVELMGGQIGVESTKGIGSSFWFTVCCQAAKEAVVATDSSVAVDQWVASRPLNILVAEDNDVNQYLIQRILNNLDHSVEIAKDGKCAIDLFNSGDFDIILMDVRMPLMDGTDATVSIRAMDSPKSNIPIIALTADASTGHIVEYRKVGMNDVCLKPIELPLLLKSINKSLGEEIHTSMPHVSASAASQQRIDPSTSTEEHCKIESFDQVLPRVASIGDQMVEQNKGIENPSGLRAALGEDAFEELLTIYEGGLEVQCDDFIKVISDLSNKPKDCVLKSKAIELAHIIKGGGGQFGYPLITTIAASADQILNDKESVTPEKIELLNNQAKALKLVSTKKMIEDDGKSSQMLLHGLASLSRQLT
ncbi:MAG: PAS domain S-box-containing protein [Candidatus Azotimanducaceae bacterium]